MTEALTPGQKARELDNLKRAAKRIVRGYKETDRLVKHAQALDMAARELGYTDYRHARKELT